MPWILWSLLGCWTPFEAREELRIVENEEHMHAHLLQASEARDAVIAGDLVGFYPSVVWLEKRLPLRHLRGDLGALQQPLHDAVKRARQAGELEQAADAVAEIAGACGGCHVHAGAQLPIEPMAAGFDSHMARHQAATERIWLGLVSGDPDVLTEGFATMAASPMLPEGLAAASTLPAEATALEVRAHDAVGLAALPGATPAERLSAFSDLLFACGSCHAAYRSQVP